MYYTPPDELNLENINYTVLGYIVLPQGAVLFCQTFNGMVAIKQSELMYPSEQDIVKRMFALNFKNVAKVSDIIHPNFGKRQYYIMESSDITLEQLLLKSPNDTIYRERYILKQVLSGIAELHQSGWVHGEIDPTNIIIERKYEENLYSDTYKISIWESFLEMWMAQSKSRPYIDEPQYQFILNKHQNVKQNYKIDLWAFGFLAFKLYTGTTIQVDNKYQLNQKDYQVINKQLNTLNIDNNVYEMLTKIFDQNSQETAADLVKHFQKLGTLNSTIVRKSLLESKFQTIDNIIEFYKHKIQYCKF